MTRDVSRLTPDADVLGHPCGFKMAGGTSGVTALVLLVTIPCLEVIASSKGRWVGARSSATKPATSVLRCWLMGLELSWRFSPGENLGALTRSVFPADRREQDADRVGSDKQHPAAGQQLPPSQRLNPMVIPHWTVWASTSTPCLKR